MKWNRVGAWTPRGFGGSVAVAGMNNLQSFSTETIFSVPLAHCEEVGNRHANRPAQRERGRISNHWQLRVYVLTEDVYILCFV